MISQTPRKQGRKPDLYTRTANGKAIDQHQQSELLAASSCLVVEIANTV